MNYQQALLKLTSIGQSHLLKYWESLTPPQREEFLEQIARLDIDVFNKQKQLLKQNTISQRQIEPFKNYHFAGNLADQKRGKELIAQGLMGCLMVAGGQATRLQLNGPKGMFPVTNVKHKSFFQLFAEKVAAAGKQAGRPLFLAIMTSPLNHFETVNFFENHNFFGLNKEHIFFFSQEMLPFLNREGQLFLETPYHMAEGPDGNGSALKHFYDKGIWDHWRQQGVKYLNFILVDNPLADPFDAELLGAHWRLQSDITVKCTSRCNPQEKVGILAKEKGKATVVEYSEISATEREAVSADGQLDFLCANLSLFCFNMDFVQKSAKTQEMPLHLAFKTSKYLANDGMTHQAEKAIAWKFEKFIFDLLPLAEKVNALLYPRNFCFAPLKNLKGEDSLKTVQEALEKSDQRIFSEITGKHCNKTPIELAQDFYYPTPTLLAKWKGKEAPPEAYIEP